MAQITFTIPDGQVTRINNAFATAHGWTGTGPDGQPESKAQFARRMIRAHIIGVVRDQEAGSAAVAARQSAATQAEVDLAGIT